MSLRGLLSARCTIYRPAGTKDEYGDKSATPVMVRENVRTSVIDPFRPRDIDRGPGDMMEMRESVYFEKSAPIQENDVILITKGPDAGQWWRILFRWTPEGRHVECHAIPYYGPKP